MTAQHLDDDADTLVWDRVPPAGPDRTTRLDAEEVARAAMAVADAENLPAVAVKRVANRLRIPAPRLQAYVHDREELYDLMLDVALGDVERPDPDAGWRTRLEQLATRTRAVAQVHPWLVDLVGGRPPTGPLGLRYVEDAVAACAASGADVRSAALSFNALLAYVSGSVRIETRSRAARSARPVAPASHADHLAGVVADGHHPMLAALFAEAADVTADESFEHGLARLLDGIAGAAGGRTIG